MNIRLFNKADLHELKEIHEKFYSKEFLFSDFCKNFFECFVMEDADGIISCGGLRPIAEAVAITNKDRSVRDRRTALIKLMQVNEWTAREHGFHEIHAFIQDEKWQKQLEKYGFRKTKGNSLVIEVDNGKR